MDRLVYMSMSNCVKELDALKMLVLSGRFSLAEVADWISEISWNLSNVAHRRRYDSDEFQCRLKKLVRRRKEEEEDIEKLKEPEREDV